MRIVKVKFLSSRDESESEGYSYKDELETALNKYDAVLVPTRYGTSLAVVEEVGINENNLTTRRPGYRYSSPISASNLKSVYEKIESTTITKELKAEKAKDIKAKLDKAIKKIDSVKKYEMYAELDPSISEMLNALKELDD